MKLKLIVAAATDRGNTVVVIDGMVELYFITKKDPYTIRVFLM